MAGYTKPALTFAEQLQQLRDRGLQVADDDRAMAYLERVGYYRLMGYLFPLRQVGSDNYVAGATFEAATTRYEFDQVLRLLVMEAIGSIEVAARTTVTYHIGHTYGAFGHADPYNVAFDDAWHTRWLKCVDDEVSRAHETFIDHYAKRYDDPKHPRVPIWMASEVMSLGSLSKLVKGMHAADAKVVAGQFGLRAKVFANWLHVVSHLRNVAAHHGRLWNRVFGVQAMRPDKGPFQNMAQLYPVNRTFFSLQMLRSLLRYTTTDADNWRNRVNAHLQTLINTPELEQSIGAPPNWCEHPAWR